jgi:protein-ribulosamine 3-kinase
MILDQTFRAQLGRAISEATGEPCTVRSIASVSGGCINRAFIIADGARRYFVKTNTSDRLAMFEAEAAGLRELASMNALRVPQPLRAGVATDTAFLVLEYLDLGGQPDAIRLGRGLADLHRARSAQFGWSRDNTIGATPQINNPSADWCEFWRERRLRPQFERAYRNGHPRLRGEGDALLARVSQLLAGHRPSPSLLHGDLWGGNVGGLADGTPVLFDPAVYFGDRETDIAMTELFGGFSPAFYAAYNEACPLDTGYAQRKHLYNLYHLLNHLNLFGSGYLAGVRGCVARLLELR